MPTPSLIEALEARIAPATFTVSTLVDSGAGSFRQAILDANGASGADSIVFDLPGTGLQVISPLSPLPTITDTVAIAVTHTDSTEAVRIDGTSAGLDAVGLQISGVTGFQISGLEIAHFSSDGLVLENATVAKIQNSKFFSNGGSGIRVTGGGGHQFSGNIVGETPDDTSTGGNGLHGILLLNTINNGVGNRDYMQNTTQNRIEGNGMTGISIVGGHNNVVSGCIISGNGFDAAIGSTTGGVVIENSDGNLIGGISGYNLPGYGSVLTNEGNQIVANNRAGVIIIGAASFNNVLGGNTVSLNVGSGLEIKDGAHHNTTASVYSYLDFRGNFYDTANPSSFISNSGFGVVLDSAGIGNSVVGGMVRANGLGGILVQDTDMAVLGLSTPLANPPIGSSPNKITLQDNLGPGVSIVNGHGIAVVHNEFINNSGPAVDLGGDGSTVNDPGDIDSGSNGLLNYPIITKVAPHTYQGSISTDRPSATLTVELYSYDSATKKHTYVTSRSVTTDANGTASFTTSENYTALLIDPATGDTSEMSPFVVELGPDISLSGGGSIVEGNSGSQQLHFTVTLSQAYSQTVTVDFKTVDGSATGGSDFTPLTGTLTFAPGVTSLPIDISILGDTTQEAKESFSVVLTGSQHGFLIPDASEASGTIVNDDAIPTVNVVDTVIGEPAPGTNPNFGTIPFTLALSGPSLEPVTVHVQLPISNQGSVITSVITFEPGQTTATGTLQVATDSVAEANTSIFVTIDSPTNATTGHSQGTVTVIDDDSWGVTIGDITITEGDNGVKMAHVPVTISALVTSPFNQVISFDYLTQDQTALDGSDYSATSGHLSFANGPASTTIDIPISGDFSLESDEVFKVLAQNLIGARLVHEGTVTITNDDTPPPSISIGDVAVVEGNDGTTDAVFTIMLSAAGQQAVSVHYQTANGTATAGSDFTHTSGDLIFPVGVTSLTVSVPIGGDTSAEAHETFLVQLSDATNATIDDGEATGTINNDDAALSIGDVSIAEGNTGTSSAVFTVTLSGPLTTPVTVNYAAASGTAVLGEDFALTPGQLTFAAGETTKTISIAISSDTTVEGDETFALNLSDATGASITDGQGMGTIVNDDFPGPQLVISANHKVAKWRDVDGDKVTLVSNLPVLYPDSFDFASVGEGGQLIHFQTVKAPTGVPINLSFTAAKTSQFPAGDGVVNVGRIDLTDLTGGVVLVSGDLGSIFAGTLHSRTPALTTLNVGSLGALGLTTQGGTGSLESVFGKVGTIVVHGEWSDASVFATTIAKVKVLGGIQPTGLVAGTPDAGVTVDGKLGKMVVTGGITGANETHPFVVKTNGNKPGVSDASSLALGSLTVTGDVVNAAFLAGTDGTVANSGARIGTVSVTGNWIASNIIAGATYGADHLFGTSDDLPGVGDGLISRIASVTITGSVSGTASAGDHFGFVAEKIQRVSIGGTRLSLDPLSLDVMELGLDSDVTVREIA